VARVGTDADLRAVAVAVAHADPDLRVLVVGRGSNLLVADRGFPGLALVLADHFEHVELDRPAGVVRAGGATPLPVVARRAAAGGLTGLEFYVGIPGSVGGAVRMNAGGHGRDTTEVLRAAWVWDLRSGADAPTAWDVPALEFGYRTSALTAAHVVTTAEFTATPDTPASCTARIDEIVRWRREHQPGGANAGSVFRNPPGDSAGRLIDTAGLKGFRVGGAVVSEKHANFFQAETGATADDVARLVTEVQARVHAATGVQLVPELQLVGFDPVGCR
jgi:UDP-N-acetylmuramate dehydrogenase